MKLAFKNKWGKGFVEREVPVLLRIGTFEDIKADKGLDFPEIGAMMTSDTEKIMTLILYYGYLTACQKAYKKPKYTESKALYWYLKLDYEAKKEFNREFTTLFGETIDSEGKKKVKINTL